MSASVPPPIPNAGPVIITGPLSIPDLLDRTFRALRARFGVLVLSAAMVMVPVGTLTLLLSGSFMSSYLQVLEYSVMETDSPDLVLDQVFGDMAGFFGVAMLMSVLYLLGSTLVSLLSIYHIERFLHGENSTFSEGWRVAIRRLLPMIGMQILQFLAIGMITTVLMIIVGVLIFGVALVFGGALSTVGNDTANIILFVGMIIAIIVAYILLIVLMLAPSVVFMGRWLAASPILVVEGLGPVKSLQRSWSLTKGRMWRGILFVVLLWLISFILISLPVGVVQMVAGLAMPAQLTTIAIISTAVSYLLNLFYQPFFAAGTTLFYYDLRVRAEAYDVALRVAALEAEIAPDAPRP